eukprot:356979-Chlamydomonas_euryale.AAC.6
MLGMYLGPATRLGGFCLLTGWWDWVEWLAGHTRGGTGFGQLCAGFTRSGWRGWVGKGWLRAVRSVNPVVTAPSPLLDPLCLAALNTDTLFGSAPFHSDPDCGYSWFRRLSSCLVASRQVSFCGRLYGSGASCQMPTGQDCRMSKSRPAAASARTAQTQAAKCLPARIAT